MSVSHIANFSARIGNVAVTPQGFGTPLILAYHTNFPQDIKTYRGDGASILGALTADGFTVGTPVYEVANTMLGQVRAPRTIKVGRLDVAPAQEVELTPTNLTVGTVYALTFGLDGAFETFTYTVESGDTATDIATALHTAINAGGLAITSVNTTPGLLSVEPDTAGDLFTLIPTVNGKVGDVISLEIEDVTPAPAGLANRLTAIHAQDPDFFFVVPTISSLAIGTVLGTWVPARKKLLMAATSDAAAFGETPSAHLMGVLTAASNNYASVTHSPIYGAYPQAAFIGKLGPTTPGAEGWANQTLRGTQAAPYTAGQFAALDANRYTVYRPISNTLAGTRGAYVGGDFVKIETTIGLSWAEARAQEAVANLLLSAAKVSFTEEGYAAIEGAIQRVSDQGVSNGLIDPGDPDSATRPPPRIVMPPLDELDPSEKAQGILTGVQWTFTIAGNIETVLNGDIVVQF